MNYSDGDINDYPSNHVPESIPEPEEINEPEIYKCDACGNTCEDKDCVLENEYIFCNECTEQNTITELLELMKNSQK